jgi:hypothetical protein
MIRIVFFFVIIFSGQLIIAQTPVKFRKVLGNTGYDYGYSAIQTKDHGYIIGGSTSSFGSGNTDMFFVKTDSMGIPLKNKTFGGINIDKAQCIRQTNDKGFVLFGYTNSFGAGGYDLYLVKMDSLYNTEWEKTYGGTDWDFGNCIEQTADGGYILCGSTFSYGKGDEDYYLLKVNSAGDTLWTKTYGGTKEDVAKSVIQTIDGGYVLTGFTKSLGDELGDIYTIKTNSSGDTLWTNRFGGAQADFGNDVVESITGGYLVGGETSSIGFGNADGGLIHIDTAGALLRTTTIGGSQFDNIISIAEDRYGRIAMLGNTQGFGSLNQDFYFFIIDSGWWYANSTTYGTIKHENAFSVENTNDNGFILCGSTTGYNNGLEDIYLIKTDTFGLSGFTGSETNISIVNVPEMYSQANNGFMVYPNPANNMLNIDIYNNWNKQVSEIVIFDILGKEIRHFKSGLSKIYIDTSDLENGLYFIGLKNENSFSSQKLLIHH